MPAIWNSALLAIGTASFEKFRNVEYVAGDFLKVIVLRCLLGSLALLNTLLLRSRLMSLLGSGLALHQHIETSGDNSDEHFAMESIVEHSTKNDVGFVGYG